MNRKQEMKQKQNLHHVLQKCALLCVVFLLCIVVPPAAVSAEGVTADYSWYNSASTEFTISDVGDLVGFANIVNGADEQAKDTFAGKTVLLDADIDLTGVVWTPIGTSNYDSSPTYPVTKMFAGIFDGGEHTITGLSSDGYVPSGDDTKSKEYSFGLFGYVYGANIANVKFANVAIDCGTRPDSENNDVAGSGVAALVGYYVPKHDAVSVIENCHVLSGTVKATNNMGGLIGHFDSQKTLPTVDVTIKDCSNAADVTTEAREAGGILGLINGGRESGDYTVVMRGTITFENCFNSGAITALSGGGSTCAGGILGRDNAANSGQRLKIIFDRCENSGKITVHTNGETHVAGLGTAFYTSGSWLVAKDCKNRGNIVATKEGNVYAGGLFASAGVIDLYDSMPKDSMSEGAVIVDGVKAGTPYVGDVHSILFLDGIDDFNDTITGNTYYLNGGTSPGYYSLVDDAAYGGNFHLVETAYNNGKVFSGWHDNVELTGDACTSLSSLAKRYYAKWVEGITFNANGGTGIMEPLCPSVSQLPLNNFTRTNYHFAGWNTKDDGTGTPYADGAGIQDAVMASDTIFYAQWESVVTFDANGGFGSMEEVAIEEGKGITPTNAFTAPEGYEFAGWKTKSYGTEEEFASIIPKGNVTLYAQWRGTIAFDANEGTGEMGSLKILKGHTVLLPSSTFTRTGYTFNNWNTNSDNTGTRYDDETLVFFAENMILYANWTECTNHAFTQKVAEPEYLKSPATYTEKAVYYKSCSVCGISSKGKEREAIFEFGEVLEEMPESPSSGGPSSQGTYITMIRDAPKEGGEVLFKYSATPVESVTVPAGIVDGKIIVSANTDASAPEGKDVEALFDVSITGSYPAGEETVIMVTLLMSELTERGLTEADACIYHFDGEEWTKLFTTYEVDGNNVIYRGTTMSCSPFALVYEIGGAVLADEEPADEPIDEPTQQPDDEVPGEILPPADDVPTDAPETPVPILGLLAGLGCAAAFIWRK